MLQLKTVEIKKPAEINIIFGQSHFIKTVEDLHETLVAAVPGIKFGLAFCESSGSALIRTSGTDKSLVNMAAKNAAKIACGHSFLIFLKDSYPINVLNRIKMIDEVVTLFCATANQVIVIIAKTKTGQGVLGVIDGQSSCGIELNKEKNERKALLRQIGYKF